MPADQRDHGQRQDDVEGDQQRIVPREDTGVGRRRHQQQEPGNDPERAGNSAADGDETLHLASTGRVAIRNEPVDEDLGTVEKRVRRQLAQNQMLSYKLLWFEDDLPADYPELALAAVTTHDLPTVAGPLVRRGLHGPTADRAATQRARISGDPPPAHGSRGVGGRTPRRTEAVAGAYQALGRAPSAVLAATLEDALAVEERPNMPGTIDQWPNWSQALPQPLEEIETLPLPKRIAEHLRRSHNTARS